MKYFLIFSETGPLDKGNEPWLLIVYLGMLELYDYLLSGLLLGLFWGDNARKFMAIYELYDTDKEEHIEASHVEEGSHGKGRFFSTLVTRLCFLLLLVGDLFWIVYNVLLLGLVLASVLLTGGRAPKLKRELYKRGMNLRRGAVCALSLLLGLVSPPFGIMIACTYFLMYDKEGMEAVVPASLQGQFKNLFQSQV